MMEQALQATCLCVLAAVLALVVKRGSPEAALLLVLGAAVAVLLSLGQALREMVDFLEELGRCSGMPEGLMAPLYKVAGIAVVVKIGGGLCADAGESALAAAVETAGTVCALAAALPLLRTVMELLTELMA